LVRCFVRSSRASLESLLADQITPTLKRDTSNQILCDWLKYISVMVLVLVLCIVAGLFYAWSY
jgi:hypothetical protein